MLEKYKNEEVIAYRESFMGLCFLFKGKIDFFAFSIVDEPFTKNYINVYRIDVEKVIKMFEKNGEGKLIILNEDLYRKFNANLLLRGLKDES